jgi:hypothetical protein
MGRGRGPDGFEQTRPSVSRRTVILGECDSVFEVELTAQIHGIPVRVLQRAGEQALVLLTGISRDDGARLGATEVEPGRYELTTTNDTLTNASGTIHELSPQAETRP